MANFNKVIVAANLVSDPELKTVGDSNVVKFRIAINRKFTTKSGEKKEECTYIDCEMWGARAAIISDYLGKGDPILIEGHLRQENWDTKDGEKRSKILISIEDFEFINSKKQNNNETIENKQKLNSLDKNKQKKLEDIPF